MPPGLELGINQGLIHLDFEPAAAGRDQAKRLDAAPEALEQFLRQAYSLAVVVSDDAECNADLHIQELLGA